MLNAKCKMQNAKCKMQNAKFKMQNAKCKIQNSHQHASFQMTLHQKSTISTRFPRLHVQSLCVYFQKKYHNPFPYETNCSQPWKLKNKFALLLVLPFHISCWWSFCVIWWVLFIFLWGKIFVIYNTWQTWLRPQGRKSCIIVHPLLSEEAFFKAKNFAH